MSVPTGMQGTRLRAAGPEKIQTLPESCPQPQGHCLAILLERLKPTSLAMPTADQ